jgi:hypothetical protein
VAGAGSGGGARVTTWNLAATRGVATFELVDFVFQVRDLISEMNNGAIRTVFDALEFIALTKDFVVCVFKVITEACGLRASVVNLAAERIPKRS